MDIAVSIADGTQWEKIFVEDLLNYIIISYCEGFNLDIIEKLIVIKELSNNSDGRIDYDLKTVFLSRRILDQLQNLSPHYHPNEKILLNNLLNDGKCNIVLANLVSTIYHELCHADSYYLMPKLYSKVIEYDDNNEWDLFTTLFWIEYSVHLKYKNLNKKENIEEYCEQFIEYKWDLESESGFFYFIKASAYFISRLVMNSNVVVVEEIKRINNEKVSKLIETAYKMCDDLILLYPFDDFKILIPLRDLYYDFYNN